MSYRNPLHSLDADGNPEQPPDDGVIEKTVTFEFAPQPPRERRAAVMFLGEDVLARLLRLPAGWRIAGVRDDFLRNGVMLRLTGPTAPLVPEGGEPYSVHPELEYESPTPEELAADPGAVGTLRVILPDWLTEGNDQPWLRRNAQP